MFNRILVVGPDHKSKALDALIKSYNFNHSSIAMHDKEITPESFTILDKQIDIANRIDMFFHGSALKLTESSQDFHHYSTVMKGGKYIDTGMLFEKLAKVSSSVPLLIYFWSCYGNLSQEHAIKLPAGSILITHNSSASTSLVCLDVYAMQQQTKVINLKSSMWEQIYKNLSYDYLFGSIAISYITSDLTAISFEWDRSESHALYEAHETLYELQKSFFNFLRNTLQLSLVNIVLDYNSEVDEGIYLWSLLSNDVLNSPDEVFKTHFYNLSKTQLKELINKNVEGYTLLEVAAYAGNTNVIEQLVQEGASPNVGNPVYMAASMNQIKAMELLKNNGANIERQEEDKGYTPLHIACEEGYLNCVSLLLKVGASNNILNYAGYRSSTLAIAKGRIDILELMLEREVNIYSLDSKNNVLIAASGADENECEMIELLCTRKAADINEQDQDGTTALTNAVMLEKVSLVEYLLSHEANANIPLNDGYTAYQLAEEKNNIELMKMLGQLDIEALD